MGDSSGSYSTVRQPDGWRSCVDINVHVIPGLNIPAQASESTNTSIYELFWSARNSMLDFIARRPLPRVASLYRICLRLTDWSACKHQGLIHAFMSFLQKLVDQMHCACIFVGRHDHSFLLQAIALLFRDTCSRSDQPQVLV